MLCKGLKVKDIKNNIYTVVKCDDIHNIELTEKGIKGYGLWCADKDCENYDGELIPINLKDLRKVKIKSLSQKDLEELEKNSEAVPGDGLHSASA